MPAHIFHPWLDGLKPLALAVLLLLAADPSSAQNPKDNFCRRFAHQTAVIDDKLYIDGGWVNYDSFQRDHENISNTWLAYHDLNHLIVANENEWWPDLNISLSKNDSIPTVHGGVLWPDEVNKRFYVYGGEWYGGLAAEPYHLLSYDIINNQWDDFGRPDVSPSPLVAGYGAGVGVSETGMGYYYGGWISNASMSGWTQTRAMSNNFYSFDYDSGQFLQASSPDQTPRAEGAMVWIPAGDSPGMLVYLGGIQNLNGTSSPQPLDQVFVYDTNGDQWSTQEATGVIPQNRRQFCTDVAWAPDKSSFNIYLWGGHSVFPPVTDAQSYNDIYILTLPSFTWVKAYPDRQGNATLPPRLRHYSGSCNMVKSMSQMFVIGGTYTDTDACDTAANIWGVHNWWTGTYNNDGNNNDSWALYDPNVTTNVVPFHVYDVVGGNKEGGATVTEPSGGFSQENRPLSDLMARRPGFAERTPTRAIPGPTGSSDSSSGSGGLSTGAIVGIAIGSTVGFVLLLFAWFLFGRRVVRRRQARAAAKTMQTGSIGDSSHTGATVASRYDSVMPWIHATTSWNYPQAAQQPSPPPPQPPSELPIHRDGELYVVSELPNQDDPSTNHGPRDNAPALSPVSHVGSHPHPPLPTP
ncbi:hypothetical protein B0I35DRAFT_451549 [Stachybotrys elegans]|uniref:Kelch repeat-containing protein n=1 Tax=Stachybotrys elegans TaxID=80388 RepID=A0A8K0WQV8_9HYPO|nr:hypothetical protein B0I35DRAFT_451549 [Stachybotrys elegans]